MASPNEVVNAAPAVVEAGEQLEQQHQQQQNVEQQAVASVGQGQGQTANRFIPYHSPHHNPTKGRYITSNDPRGYM